MRYVLGLDIGIASVGWSVINQDKCRIEDVGVRAFNAAEDPKTKAPLAEPRRTARGMRRRLRRRAGRLRRAKDLFIQYGLILPADVENAFTTSNGKPDPWQLRAEGLDRLLTGEELARVLYHIAKRRGFKSNRKHDKKGEDGVVLESIHTNRELMAAGGYRTAGEMIYRDAKFAAHKRNKADSYENTVDRMLLEEEVHILFATQRRLGSNFASPEFECDFSVVLLWQMPFSSGDDVLNKVGVCTFERDEKRAPRNSWTAERFILLDSLNRLSVSVDGNRRRLTPEERQTVQALAYKNTELKYTQIRKVLDLPEEARFVGLTYAKRQEGRMVESKDCEKAVFTRMQGYHALKKVLGGDGLWDTISNNTALMDDLAFALTFYKTDDDIRVYLTERTDAQVTEAVLSLTGFSKVTHLSLKAMRNLIPHLEQGMLYSEACEAAGYNHYDPRKADKQNKLPAINPDDVRNPVVLRALTQARKVINAVIQRYGQPCGIHIEFAREIGKTADERAKISRRIEENRRNSQEDREHFREIFNREPNGLDLAKWRLYREQNGQCAYCQRPIEIERLFEPGYAEIDHILPYSRSFDDGLSNRVLVLSVENQHKRDRTPYEYFGDNEAKWEQFGVWVNETIRDHRKRENLLAKNYAARQDEWMRRNLNDTQYIARFLSNYIKQYLLFADDEVKQPVVCLNGRVTALARGLWGLAKHRDEDDLHHALDASVIAVLTPQMIKLITEYRKAMETGRITEIVNPDTGEIYEVIKNKPFAFPEPWKGFRAELLARLSDDPALHIADLGIRSYSDMAELHPILVSRMPIRKARGAMHLETIRSKRVEEGKCVSVIRKKLQDLKLSDLDKLYAPETNEKLYDAIRERLAQYGGDGAKAFKEELRKPTNDGKPGPVARSVKLYQNQPSGVNIRGGVADNGDIVRTDVFAKDNKYYLVPVYVHDFMSGILPCRAISAGKSYDQWTLVDDTYEFRFSLYPYDLIKLVMKNEAIWGYYRGVDRAGGVMKLSPPNKNSELIRISPRSAVVFDKYEVGILSDLYKVRKEVRRGLEDCSDHQPSEVES